MGKDLETRVIKLLKQRRWTKKELATTLEIPQTKILAILRILDKKGVDISKFGKGKDKEFYLSTSPESSQPQYVVLSGVKSSPQKIKFALTSDWHVGSIQHNRSGLEDCIQRAVDEGAKFVLHAGDVHDGYKVYRGQLNNLTVWRAEDQTDLSADIIDRFPIPVYGIAGNHDYSYTKLAGIRPTKLLASKTDNFKDLGDARADLVIGGIELRLLHGAGGNAYAISYPAQKYLRNIARGDPSAIPEMLGLGHYHTNTQFESHDCVVIHPGNFQGPNEFTERRGLLGPMGLYVVELTTQDGTILNYKTKFLKARS